MLFINLLVYIKIVFDVIYFVIRHPFVSLFFVAWIVGSIYLIETWGDSDNGLLYWAFGIAGCLICSLLLSPRPKPEYTLVTKAHSPPGLAKFYAARRKAGKSLRISNDDIEGDDDDDDDDDPFISLKATAVKTPSIPMPS